MSFACLYRSAAVFNVKALLTLGDHFLSILVFDPIVKNVLSLIFLSVCYLCTVMLLNFPKGHLLGNSFTTTSFHNDTLASI